MGALYKQRYDRLGIPGSKVISGSAFIEDDKMYVYYTGNVKLEDGDFDYINTGRESNTVLVVSEDGKTFGSKKELMRNVDYPSDLTEGIPEDFW